MGAADGGNGAKRMKPTGGGRFEWTGTRHNRGVLALESAKKSTKRRTCRGSRGTCLEPDEFHPQPVFNERIFVETQVCAPRKEVLPSLLFPSLSPRGAANSKRVTGRKRMMGGEISFRKLRDTFLPIIFCFSFSRNRIEKIEGGLQSRLIFSSPIFWNKVRNFWSEDLTRFLRYVIDITEKGERKFRFYRSGED